MVCTEHILDRYNMNKNTELKRGVVQDGYRPNSVARTICTQDGYAEQVVASDLPPELRYMDDVVKTHIKNELRTLKGHSKGNESDEEPNKASLLARRERLVKEAEEQFLMQLREIMDETSLENEVGEIEDLSTKRTSNQSIQVRTTWCVTLQTLSLPSKRCRLQSIPVLFTVPVH
ncbi:hypothetical protein CSKR_106384 [Clonorchis sinensis]|uniref:Uncharacterized protein n=1 Tax=Clonorchis sinensis TaxID=79923 RepID=A0A8T1MFG8_CLOSI|nr:hypothetical protein CSKR_106384 [Clonorchis sinensis]